jgi:hypothetical protein
MSKIKIYLMEVGENGCIKEIENSLEVFQTIVGGYIEILSLDKECILDLVCNEEGKIKAFSLNRAWLSEGEIVEVIAGSCFVTRHNKDGDSISIEETDVPKIEAILKQVIGVVGNTILLAKEEPKDWQRA